MKRPFSILAFLMASASTIAAEESSYTPLPVPWDFLAVKDLTICTNTAFIVNNMIYWDEPGFHTGIQKGSLTLFSIKEIPEKFEAPESPNTFIRFIDAYGNLTSSHEMDISDDFTTMGFVENWASSCSAGCTVNRGGQYTVEFGLAPNLFKYEQQVIIQDEACARVYDTFFKKGEQMTSTLNITGGYPFNPSSLTGEHSLVWTLASADSPEHILAKGNETFSLETEQDLMAPLATIKLEYGSLEPGKYLCSVSSDFAPASRTFDVEVYDVLQTDISMDKDLYVIGTDSEVNLQIAIKYGYPHISLNSDTGKHTIIVKAELCGEEYVFDFSDERWSNSDVDYTADITVPLNGITNDIANEYDFKLPLGIKVVFNGATQFENTVEIPIADTSGIESINADSGTMPEYYNVFGQKVDYSYRGIVITSDGRKILSDGN